MPGFWQKLWMRRTFIVDRKFQGEVIVRSVASSLFLMFVIVLGLFVPLMLEIERSEGAHPLDANAVASVFLYLHEHLLPILGVYLVLAVLTAIRFSHRIAGPMVRFKRDMYAIGEGRFPPPLRTRDDDYMQAEVRALNFMSKSLAQHADEICRAEDALHAAMTVWQDERERGGNGAAAFAALRTRAAELRAKVDFFRHDAVPPALTGPGDTVDAVAVPVPVAQEE